MAHEQQLLCVKQIVNASNLRSSDTIVEIGSWDVNGSVRQFFDASTYIGLDLAEGKGVDRVYVGQDLTCLESDSIDVAISCECFEHNPFWRENLNDMVRITKPGGIIVVTCASRGRFVHGTVRRKEEITLLQSRTPENSGAFPSKNQIRLNVEKSFPLFLEVSA